jgi:elongation factor P hydroxylase
MTERVSPDTGDRAGLATELAGVFNRLFQAGYRTQMRGGADEPLYLPATATAPALVIYTRDYAASALHEAAHWCIAGPRRRQLVDYGYAYVPPPRSPAQQQRFFHHELRVQALERIFAEAANLQFRVSLDDPHTNTVAAEEFAGAVAAEAARLQARGLPVRAAWFHGELVRRFGRVG